MDLILQHLSAMKKRLWSQPSLQFIFLELTRACNLKCLHCGSSCPTEASTMMLHAEDVKKTIQEITTEADPRRVMFCLTGGEPLLNPEWEAIAGIIHSTGFNWGMTSNGTLINEDTIEQLSRSGMKTISISIDGLVASHERFRRVPGSFQKALNAVHLLVDSRRFQSVQVTTVVNPINLAELEEMYQLFADIGVDSWKLTGVEPVGDARKHTECFLNQAEYVCLLDFIKKHRPIAPFEITYGCSHFLPLEYDNTVRTPHFICGAGTLIASITCEGDIVACLDIDDRVHTKQGNIHQDSFWDVWKHRFKMFRQDKELSHAPCGSCEFVDFCQGDSWHTWDFENSSPRICLHSFLSK